MQLTYWAISARLDSIAPFGRDSVPEVYISRTGSSSATTTSRRLTGPDLAQPATSSHPGSGAVPASAIQPRTPSGVPATWTAWATCGYSASSTITPVAPQWSRM